MNSISPRTRKLVWVLMGFFVVPLCVNLLFWVPFQIAIDRDLQINGVTVASNVVEERDLYTKSGYVKQQLYRYKVADREYEVWLAGPASTLPGAEIQIVYPPLSPSSARLARPGEPWDKGLGRRLFTIVLLGLMFLSVWVGGLISAFKKS